MSKLTIPKLRQPEHETYDDDVISELTNVNPEIYLFVNNILSNITNFSFNSNQAILNIIKNIETDISLYNKDYQTIINFYCDLLNLQKNTNKSFACSKCDIEKIMIKMLEDIVSEKKIIDVDIIKEYKKYINCEPKIIEELIINILFDDKIVDDFINILQKSDLTVSTSEKITMEGGYGKRTGNAIRNIGRLLYACFSFVNNEVSKAFVETAKQYEVLGAEAASSAVTLTGGIDNVVDLIFKIDNLDYVIEKITKLERRIIKVDKLNFVVDGTKQFSLKLIQSFYKLMHGLFHLYTGCIPNPICLTLLYLIFFIFNYIMQQILYMVPLGVALFSPSLTQIVTPQIINTIVDMTPVLLSSVLLSITKYAIGRDKRPREKISNTKSMLHSITYLPMISDNMVKISNQYITAEYMSIFATILSTDNIMGKLMFGFYLSTEIYSSYNIQKFLQNCMSDKRDIELRKYSINNIVEFLSLIQPKSFEYFDNTNKTNFLIYVTENVALNKALDETSFWNEIKKTLQTKNENNLRNTFRLEDVS